MSKNTAIAIVVTGIVLAGGVIVYGIFSSSDNAPEDKININTPSMDTELKIEDVKVGTGKEAKAGDSVTVHYVGTFPDGKKFDSSRDRGEPFTFTLGARQVIAGWDQGVAGMKEGGLRKLSIPPQLGYGMNDYGSIPGGSTLLFEVELIKVGQ